MSRPDFDGVYRTNTSEGVFTTRKQPPRDTPKNTSAEARQNARHERGTNAARHAATPMRKLAKNDEIGGSAATRQVIPYYVGNHLAHESCRASPAPVAPAAKLAANLPHKPKRGREKKPPFVIIEDTRENTPLTGWPDGAAVEVRGLDTGDYSIVGWENCFTVERKSIVDLAGTMIGGFEPNTQRPRKRFNNELERMRHFDCAAIIVTATPQELIEFRHHCGMDAHAALWNFAISVFATYGIPVFPLTDEKTAARWIYDLARHYLKVRMKKNRSREEFAKEMTEDWKF